MLPPENCVFLVLRDLIDSIDLIPILTMWGRIRGGDEGERGLFKASAPRAETSNAEKL